MKVCQSIDVSFNDQTPHNLLSVSRANSKDVGPHDPHLVRRKINIIKSFGHTPMKNKSSLQATSEKKRNQNYSNTLDTENDTNYEKSKRKDMKFSLFNSSVDVDFNMRKSHFTDNIHRDQKLESNIFRHSRNLYNQYNPKQNKKLESILLTSQRMPSSAKARKNKSIISFQGKPSIQEKFNCFTENDSYSQKKKQFIEINDQVLYTEPAKNKLPTIEKDIAFPTTTSNLNSSNVIGFHQTNSSNYQTQESFNFSNLKSRLKSEQVRTEPDSRDGSELKDQNISKPRDQSFSKEKRDQSTPKRSRFNKWKSFNANLNFDKKRISCFQEATEYTTLNKKLDSTLTVNNLENPKIVLDRFKSRRCDTKTSVTASSSQSINIDLLKNDFDKMKKLYTRERRVSFDKQFKKEPTKSPILFYHTGDIYKTIETEESLDYQNITPDLNRSLGEGISLEETLNKIGHITLDNKKYNLKSTKKTLSQEKITNTNESETTNESYDENTKKQWFRFLNKMITNKRLDLSNPVDDSTLVNWFMESLYSQSQENSSLQEEDHCEINVDNFEKHIQSNIYDKPPTTNYEKNITSSSVQNFRNEEFYDSWKLLDNLERNYEAFCKRISEKKIFTIKVGKGVEIKNKDFDNYYNLLYKYKLREVINIMKLFQKPKLFAVDWKYDQYLEKKESKKIRDLQIKHSNTMIRQATKVINKSKTNIEFRKQNSFANGGQYNPSQYYPKNGNRIDPINMNKHPIKEEVSDFGYGDNSSSISVDYFADKRPEIYINIKENEKIDDEFYFGKKTKIDNKYFLNKCDIVSQAPAKIKKVHDFKFIYDSYWLKCIDRLYDYQQRDFIEDLSILEIGYHMICDTKNNLDVMMSDEIVYETSSNDTITSPAKIKIVIYNFLKTLFQTNKFSDLNELGINNFKKTNIEQEIDFMEIHEEMKHIVSKYDKEVLKDQSLKYEINPQFYPVSRASKECFNKQIDFYKKTAYDTLENELRIDEFDKKNRCHLTIKYDNTDDH